MKKVSVIIQIILVIISTNCSNDTPKKNEPVIVDTTNSIEPNEDVINEIGETNEQSQQIWNNQKLKEGEKIIKINWGMENKTHLNKDIYKDEFRFASCNLIVPNGKKWVLLYINEDYNFPDQIVSAVPYLSINGELVEFYNRSYSQPDNINLSQAKDENARYYSGAAIKAISSRKKGIRADEKFTDYKGEMWFLEINE